jgi:hypothetical protein
VQGLSELNLTTINGSSVNVTNPSETDTNYFFYFYAKVRNHNSVNIWPTMFKLRVGCPVSETTIGNKTFIRTTPQKASILSELSPKASISLIDGAYRYTVVLDGNVDITE